MKSRSYRRDQFFRWSDRCTKLLSTGQTVPIEPRHGLIKRVADAGGLIISAVFWVADFNSVIGRDLCIIVEAVSLL